MAANPALVQTHSHELVPAPYPGEVFLLKRGGVEIALDGLRTPSGKWSVRGALYLSNIRMVFIGDKPDASGLAAFDFPLVYIRKDVLNQPIFGCNNLTGEVWPAEEGGGPGGAMPPHGFKVYFKEGGIGTFYPLYYALAERAKAAFARTQEAQAAAAAAPSFDPNPASYAQGLMRQAYVDPNDPSTVYVAHQPAREDQRLTERPRYAPSYGQDEVYEDMAPGHGGARAG